MPSEMASEKAFIMKRRKPCAEWLDSLLFGAQPLAVIGIAVCAAIWIRPAFAEGAKDRRPNILWILAEDISTNLGCYGDANAHTPHLDAFAQQAVRYENVFSVHPCCSPSRACLATGVYPTRLGTFQHRGQANVSEKVPCFMSLLRQGGYYTFNGMRGGSAKEDYNFKPVAKQWDAHRSSDVEWRNRPAGAPFFGQVNLFRTHQSQYGKRRPGEQSEDRTQHDPSRIHLPPYLPDTPAAREIWSEYHDRITQMDGEFAAIIDLLRHDGLAEDTIVFFFGDNGHGVPGGKGWLWDQGLHVPLLLYVPDRWAHLVPAKPGTSTKQIVSFVDFAPTVLGLAGVDIPTEMQGVAFAGRRSSEPRRLAFAARDFHDGASFDFSRAVRTERYHYIRNFMPHIGWEPMLYGWQHAPFLLEEWKCEAEAGRLRAGTRQDCFFSPRKPVEELYDMVADPWQMRNLACDPEHRDVLEELRGECERWMIENRDLGLLSQHELYARTGAGTHLAMGGDPDRNPVARLLEAANLANRVDSRSIPAVERLLRDDDCAVRRWGAIGMLTAGHEAAAASALTVAALDDPAPDVRVVAAEALADGPHARAAFETLVSLLSHERLVVRNETLLTIARLGLRARPALDRLDTALSPLERGPIDDRREALIAAIRTGCGAAHEVRHQTGLRQSDPKQ